jgi:Protein of unknown function (DUF1493)
MIEASPQVRDYLRRCGLSRRRLAQCTGNTRMYHDLGLYGDIAESYMEELASHYKVDLDGFEFDRYFPPEFVGGNALVRTLLSVVPFAGRAARQRRQYPPLTLEMIDRVMRTKRWRSLP